MTTFTKCRVCICDLDATVGSYDMRKLPLLAHKFVTCTDLSVSEEQRVPSELCQACYNQLEQLYAFRAKCIAADTKWRMQILAFCDEEEPIYDLEAAPSTVAVEELKESNEKQSEKLHKSKAKCKEHQLDSVEVEIENHDMETPAQPMEDDVELDAVTVRKPKTELCEKFIRSIA